MAINSGPPPAGWDKIPNTIEHKLAVLGAYRLERVTYQGRVWPPETPTPLLPGILDPILYADIGQALLTPPTDRVIPPQAFGQAFRLPEALFRLTNGAPTPGPVRVRVKAEAISGGERRTLSEGYVLEGFPEPGDFRLPFSIPLAVGESEGLGRLAEVGERYDVELTATVECAQPYTKTRRVLGLFNWSTESGWYWIPTATLTQVVPFTPQKPQLVPVAEEIFKKITPPPLEPAAPPPPPVWTPAPRLPTGDIPSPPETVIVAISHVRVEAPPLPDWLSQQGIEDIVRGYVGQLNVEGQIQEVAVGLRREIGQATARGEELAEQVRGGIRQIDLLRGEVYSVRRDFAAALTRTQDRLDTLFTAIEPLKRQVGQFLTRQEIEELVATKVTQMLADRAPPVPKASITQVTGDMVVARAGDVSRLAVTVLVNEQASYKMASVFNELVLGPGSHVFPAEVRTTGERTTAPFDLQGRAPDGTWGTMSRREVVVSAAALREPSTTSPPSIELAEVNLVELPAGGVSVYAGSIKVRTKHELASPGAGFAYRLFLWANGPPITQNESVSLPGTSEYTMYIFVPSVGFPARRPTVRIVAETYIYEIATGNQWYDRKRVVQDVEISVLYPELKVSGALKPPLEAMPASEFPLIVAYENATGIPGAGRIGGYEFPVVGRAGSVSLFGAFPNEDLASMTTRVLVEVLGPGRRFEQTDQVSYKTWRMPVKLALTGARPPAAVRPSQGLEIPVDFTATGVPPDKRVPVRLLLGDTVLAETTVAAAGAYRMTGSMTMPDTSLSGNLRLQVYDNYRDEGEQWLTQDWTPLFIPVEVPIPVLSLSVPVEQPAGEPFAIGVTIQNVGGPGEVEVDVSQERLVSRSMARGEVISRGKEIDPVWDDVRLAAEVSLPQLGGRVATRFEPYVKIVVPEVRLAPASGPERLRPGATGDYSLEVRNVGSLGTIGMAVNGTRNQEKVAAGATLRSSYRYAMPGSEAAGFGVTPYFIGRLARVVERDAAPVQILPQEAVFITESYVRIYGAPGLELVGAILAQDVRAAGFTVPPDGPQPPSVFFRFASGGYEVAEMRFAKLDYLFVAVTQGSSVKSVAVVDRGVIVERAATQYTYSPITAVGQRSLSPLLTLEAALPLPKLLSRMANLPGLSTPVPAAVAGPYRQAREHLGR